MGLGDALMAAGQAQDVYAAHPDLGPVGICNAQGKARWHPVWLHNPIVYVPLPGTAYRQSITTGKGYLPYIVNPYSLSTGLVWTGWRARDHRGAIVFSEAEHARIEELHQRPYIIIEPTASRKHSNRIPPRHLWTELTQHLLDLHLPLVQIAHPDSQPLPGVEQLPQNDFRDVLHYVAAARMLVATEGGLAHVAAATRTPAVVLWGGNISCDILGYPEHINIVDDHPETPCGRLASCAHCTLAWERVVPRHIARTISAYTAACGVP